MIAAAGNHGIHRHAASAIIVQLRNFAGGCCAW